MEEQNIPLKHGQHYGQRGTTVFNPKPEDPEQERIRQLKNINPQLEAKFNEELKQWEIWFDNKIDTPSIITISKYKFTKKTLNDIIKLFNKNQSNLRKTLNEAKKKENNIEKEYYNYFMNEYKKYESSIVSLI